MEYNYHIKYINDDDETVKKHINNRLSNDIFTSNLYKKVYSFEFKFLTCDTTTINETTLFRQCTGNLLLSFGYAIRKNENNIYTILLKIIPSGNNTRTSIRRWFITSYRKNFKLVNSNSVDIRNLYPPIKIYTPYMPMIYIRKLNTDCNICSGISIKIDGIPNNICLSNDKCTNYWFDFSSASVVADTKIPPIMPLDMITHESINRTINYHHHKRRQQQKSKK
jgi:hypothetical protein